MYLSTDLNGVILEANNAFLSKLSYKKEDIVGTPIVKLLAEDSAIKFAKNFPTLVQNKRCWELNANSLPVMAILLIA